jgi:hypothetical protein
MDKKNDNNTYILIGVIGLGKNDLFYLPSKKYGLFWRYYPHKRSLTQTAAKASL